MRKDLVASESPLSRANSGGDAAEGLRHASIVIVTFMTQLCLRSLADFMGEFGVRIRRLS